MGTDRGTGSGPDRVRARRYRADVVAVLRALPAGEVTTYGEVAAEAGHPGTARGVGQILAGAAEDLPWWRVVNVAGRLVPGHEVEHARRLAAEGVVVVDGRVPMGGR